MFTTKGDEQVEKSATSFYSSNYEFIKPDPDMEIEDEEDLLYGESGKALKMTSVGIIKYEFLKILILIFLADG